MDHRPLAAVVERTLADIGVVYTHTARDGTEGKAILRNRRVDLVICDLEMPKMDGLEFVRQVRSGWVPDPDVPVLILTAHSDQHRVLDAAKLGINGCLVKPVSRDRLEAHTTVALARRRAKATGDGDSGGNS